MNTHLGASRLYSHDQVPFAAIESAKVFHFSGYQWDTEAQKKAIKAAVLKAKEAGAAVSFDVADPFVVNRNRDDFAGLIRDHADIVFCNRDEAKGLYDESPEFAASKIAESGAIAVVKLGAEGALVRQGATSFKVKPIATDVVDTTAAGDMFAAGFLYGHLQGRPLEVCGHMAATLASDVISRIGATVSNGALGAVSAM
jgi:sugar/nucleoside kinase (ribokinase family)